MVKKLTKLSEKHAFLFWILCVLFYVVGYKVFSVNVLGKTPYDYDLAFFKFSLALLAILMMKSMYNGKFSFYLRAGNFFKGILLLWPTVLYILLNVTGHGIHFGGIVGETLLMVVIKNMSTGFYEEIIMRGMLLGHMMQHWKNDEKIVFKSVAATSVLFGAVHLGNLVNGDVFGTLFQVFYAAIIGLVFAAAFLRTKNLWACILMHGLVDISAELYTIYYVPGEIVNLQSTMGIIPTFAIILISLVVGLYELRKKKKAEIIELWK